LPDKELGEQVGAAIVSADKAPSLQGLRDFLTERGLANLKLPEQLYVLPVTAVGEVDKRSFWNSTLSACFNSQVVDFNWLKISNCIHQRFRN
jgi:non-ribosomal peptide synthetase component E (peptide arylation enzyme)